MSAAPTDQQPPPLSRREVFQDWGRGLGRLALHLLRLEDPEARLQWTLSRFPELSDEQLQEVVQPGMVLRNSSLYRTAALEQLTLPTPPSSIQ